MAAVGRARTTVVTCTVRIDLCSCCRERRSLAAQVREFGGALLAAFEKGDAEYLASLRAGHERELLNLTLSIRKVSESARCGLATAGAAENQRGRTD